MKLSFLSGATTLHYQAQNLMSTRFARTLLTLELCLTIRLPPVRTGAHGVDLFSRTSWWLPWTWTASASIPSGKENSRGEEHLRQIEVGYGMLRQVRRDVTERMRWYSAERSGPGGIRTRLIAAEFLPAQDATAAIRASRLRSERSIAAHEWVNWTPLRLRRPCACPPAGSGNDRTTNLLGREPHPPTSLCGCSGKRRPP